MSTGENTNDLKGNDMFVSNLCDKRNSSFEGTFHETGP